MINDSPLADEMHEAFTENYPSAEEIAMFMTSGLVLAIIALEFVAGCIIGLAVVTLIYRFQLRIGIATRSAVLAGTAFLLMSWVTGWAGAHAEFINGQRQNITSWDEHLWLKNHLADHQIPLCVGSSILAALLIAGTSRRLGRAT